MNKYHQRKDVINHEVKDKIAALVPFYNEEGQNCTLIILNDGTKLIRKTSVTAALKKVLKLFGHDLRALQEYYGQYFDSKLIPLALSRLTIFLPLRLRKPLGKYDGTTGYINHYQIDRLGIETGKDTGEAGEEGNGETLFIKLLSDDKIKVYQGQKSTRTKINQGIITALLFYNNYGFDSEGELSWDELSGNIEG